MLLNYLKMIGAVVKVTAFDLCGLSSIPSKRCGFFIVSLFYHRLVGFPCLTVCYWITTLNNTHMHKTFGSIRKIHDRHTCKRVERYLNYPMTLEEITNN